jgi:hypothetical protein
MEIVGQITKNFVWLLCDTKLRSCFKGKR